jgi:hypothetical protein
MPTIMYAILTEQVSKAKYPTYQILSICIDKQDAIDIAKDFDNLKPQVVMIEVGKTE